MKTLYHLLLLLLSTPVVLAHSNYLRALNQQNPHSACSAADLTEYCPDESVQADALIAHCSETHGIKAAICYMQYLCENNHDQETITGHKDCIDQECPLATHVPPLDCAKYLEQQGQTGEGVPITDEETNNNQEVADEGTDTAAEEEEETTTNTEETEAETTSEEPQEENPEAEEEQPTEQTEEETQEEAAPEENEEGNATEGEENATEGEENATAEEQTAEESEESEGTENQTEEETGNEEGEEETTSTTDTGPQEFMESPEIDVEKPNPNAQSRPAEEEEAETTTEESATDESGGLHSTTKAFLAITIPMALAMAGWIVYRRLYAPKESYPFDTHIQAATTTTEPVTTTNENPNAQIT